jgi:flagellin-like hook-associated protein FlgL
MMQRIQAENVERQTLIRQLQEEIDKLQQTKLAANEAFGNIQTLTSRLEELKQNITAKRKPCRPAGGAGAETQDGGDLQAELEQLRFEISHV